MRIGFFQFAPVFGDKESNLSRVEAALASASADLVVLPELFTTGYCFGSREELTALAEDAKCGPSVGRLRHMADQTGTALVGGIAERVEVGQPTNQTLLFNSAVVIVPGVHVPIMIYRKIHLFRQEKQLFDPGNLRPETSILKGARIGVEICFDYFFPELARTIALQGAQIVCHPADLITTYAHQITVTRALENRVFWMLCNRTGTERHAGQELTFTGRSQIVDPDGTILCEAGRDDEALKVVEIAPSKADNKSPFSGNDLFQDRRPEMYALWRTRQATEPLTSD